MTNGDKPERRGERRARLARIDPQRLEDCVAGIERDIAQDGYELVDVIVGKFEGRLLVEVLIDHEHGITTDDCARCHATVNHWFDAQDPVDGAYAIQVSSPGFDRPLRKPEHFARFAGRLVKMRVRQPEGSARKLGARIVGVEDGVLVVQGEADAEERIAFGDILEARLEHEWE